MGSKGNLKEDTLMNPQYWAEFAKLAFPQGKKKVFSPSDRISLHVYRQELFTLSIFSTT